MCPRQLRKELREPVALNRICGANCHSIGPIFEPNSSSPLAKKFANACSTPRSFSICVMYLEPFTAKTKSSGVTRAHSRKNSGFCSE